MDRSRKVKFVKFAIVAIIAIFVFGFVVMNLWNWLMPAIFGLKTVGFWQALGLLVLSWILFGGMRGGHGGRHHHSRHHMLERWMKMTPEERDEFWRGRHRHHDEPPSDTV